MHSPLVLSIRFNSLTLGYSNLSQTLTQLIERYFEAIGIHPPRAAYVLVDWCFPKAPDPYLHDVWPSGAV